MGTEKKSHGALIGSIIIIIILLVGGIYVWQSKVKTAKEQKEKNQQFVKNQETIKSDINNLNNIGQEINSADPNVGVDETKIQ